MKLLLPLFAIVLMLAGCGDSARSLPSGGASSGGLHVGPILDAAGAYLTWAGAAAVTLGLLAFAASFFSVLSVILGGFREWFLEAAILGIAAIVVGASFIYLGNHPGLLCIPVAVVAVALAIRYHSFLAKWVHPAGAPTVAPVAGPK